jgi:hypothetical protein
MSESKTGENNSFYGKHHTEESKEKNRAAHKGKPAWNKGIPMSDEQKEKLRQSKSGKKASEETRIKMSESHKKNPVKYWEGKKLSEDHKKKIAETSKGRLHSYESKVKISRSNTGKKFTEEHRANISKSHKGILTGDKNPAWNGGITTFMVQLHSSPEMDKWRRSVIEKYRSCDWFSGLKCSGKIEVHHVKRVSEIVSQYNIKTMEDALKCEELWDVNNGIVMSKENHIAHHEMWGYK